MAQVAGRKSLKNMVTSPYEHWKPLTDSQFYGAMGDFVQFCKESIILDKNGRPVPMHLNEAQVLFSSEVLKAIEPIMKKIPTKSVNVLCHKSRQMGITTVTLKLEQFVASKSTNFNILHVMPTDSEANEMIDRKFLPLLRGTHPELLADIVPVANYADFKSFSGIELDNRITFMSAGVKGAGHGRLNFVSEYVLTANRGETTWGTITVGDILYDRFGKRTTVTEVFEHKNKRKYRVHLVDGRYVDAGAEHLWLVADSHYTTKMKENSAFEASTEWLLKDGADKYCIPNPGCLDIPYQEVPIEPYLLGVILGDGYIDGNNVRIKSKYKPHPELLGEPNYIENEDRWDKSKVIPAISELGLEDKHADNKFIPRVYLNNSVVVRQALLSGLLDTDGCAGEKTRYTTISKQLAEDVQWLVRSLGGYSKISKQTKVRDNEQSVYTVSVALDYNPFRRVEKASRYNPVRIPKWSRIKNIEILDEYEDAKCVTVDSPTHTYVIGKDFIVTHNTIHMLVEDEHAKYSDPFNLEAGILPAMSGNTVRIVLFTAKGMNHSFDLSKVAQDPESDWVYIFLPWYILSEYEMEPEGRYKSLNSLTEYDLFLCSEFKRAGVSPSRWARKLQWYNYTFINEAKKDQLYMFENYPTVAAESFQASGAPIFDSRLLYDWMEREFKTIDAFYADGETRFDYVDGGAIKEYEAPIKNHQYIIGLDPAEGEVKGDDSALVVWDITKPKIKAVAAYNGIISQNDFAELAYDMAMRYNMALLVPERNMGSLMIKWLTEVKGYLNIWTDANKVTGYNNLGVRTTVSSKNEMIARLKFLMNNGYYEDFDPVFCEQGLYFTFQKTASGQLRAAGDSGHHDDAVLARMLCTMAINMDRYKGYTKTIQKEGRKYGR